MSVGVVEGLIVGLQLPPEYTVSEWADLNVFLPPETAAEPGRWRTARAPYQREMMDVQTDPDVRVIVYHTSAQVGKTAVMLNGIGYHIHHLPAPMLRLDPTIEMSEAFVKDKLDPLIRATPALAERVADEKSRSAANTKSYKSFPGGTLTMTGANSPTSLRMRSVKLVWADEIDAFPPVVGADGDPLQLAYKRTQTFREVGAKLIVASTPTLKALSRVDAMFAESDRRFFHVPCEACGAFQKLVWERVVWTKGRPESAVYLCAHCNDPMTDAAIKRQVRFGEWRPEAPFEGVVGFHIWQIYSPWSNLTQIVREYEEAERRPALKQVWWNTTLGEPYDDSEGLNIEAKALVERRRPFPATGLPEGACMICAAVDVQGDRLEVLYKAYGPDGQQWILDHIRLYGDPASDGPWRALGEALLRRFDGPYGRTFTVEAAAIDSGYMTQKVYEFSAKHVRVGRRWFAVKGMAGEGRVAWFQSRFRSRTGARVYIVGVDSLKEETYTRLANDRPGPDYLHVPAREPFTEEWFQQLTVERVQTVYDKKGFSHRQWHKPPGARNEPLDLNVYCDAVQRSLGVDLGSRLAAIRQEAPTGDAAAIAAMFG